MESPQGPRPDPYAAFFRDFDSPEMRLLRRAAYGEDIGQHSWVTAGELRADIPRLQLASTSRFLDLGCGPCGPLTFILAAVRCSGTGVDRSAAALEAGRRRAASLGVEGSLAVHVADLDEPLPFASGSFDAVMSLDVVLHLRDRSSFLRQTRSLLRAGGRLLMTDAGVITGPLSGDEVQSRSAHGFTQFVPPGWNERLLDTAGFHLIETEDRTMSAATNASGRLTAMRAHRAELGRIWIPGEFERQEAYLETVVALSRRGALSRIMYLAETPGRAPS